MKNLELFVLKHWKLIIKLGIASVILFVIIKEGGNQIGDIDFYETFAELRELPLAEVVLLIVIGLLATATMTLYDFTVIRFFEHTIKPSLFFNIAFVANALNNLLGMGGLAGATARTIMLRKNNLDFKASLYYNALILPATPTGLSLLAIFLIVEAETIAVITDHYEWIYLGIVGMVLFLPAFFLSDKIIDQFYKGNDNKAMHKSMPLKFQLVGISFLEWFSAALVFYYITSLYVDQPNFIFILSVYSIAAIAGIMSFLPGGIGSFDLIALIGLQFFQVPPSEALTILILFRVFYYLLPAFIGVAFLLINLTMDRNEKLFSYSVITNFGFFNNVMKYYKTYSDFVNVLLSILVFSSGLVLLISAIKPGIVERVIFVSEFLSNWTLQFAQSASIVVGFLLLALSFEILYKVKRSYKLTLYLLLAGGLVTFMKGLDFEEVLFLGIVMVLLKLSKPNFYRYSIPVRLSKIVFFAFVGVMGILLYFIANQKLYGSIIAHNLYPPELFGNYGDVVYHSAVTGIIFIVFLSVLYLRKPQIENDPLYAAPDFERLTQFLENQKGDALTHLLYLGDKNIFWAAEGQMLIPYAKYRDVFVVLGDPIGNSELLSTAIQEFQDFLDKYGYEAVFYEVSDSKLTTYHENGYYFFKLGEEAIVDLEKFNLDGASKSGLRYTRNRMIKSGYTFEIVEPPFDSQLFEEFKEVSDDWLGARSEMGFSLGWYNEAYLQLAPVAVLRNPESRLMAFVSLMPSYDGDQSMSTDLMRIRSEVPHGTMDFILINLMLHLKERDFKYFNLGMASLSNVGHAPNSHFREKLARFAFQYGKFFYSFEGLRKYKEKYNPIWRPRYLAYPQLISLPATLIEISMLVSSKKKKYITKD